MRRNSGIICMILGLLMIISAMLLLLYNKSEARSAAESSDEALIQVVQEIEERKPSHPRPEPEAEIYEKEPVELVSTEIEGYGYIGYLSIPALEIELPVMDDWDYHRLRIAPCRQFGETAEHLIIAAHNYTRHFGLLHTLSAGDSVYFTDMDGNLSQYEIGSVETIGPNDWDKVQDEQWNLVLYTCTYGGQSRVMAGCKLVEN